MEYTYSRLEKLMANSHRFMFVSCELFILKSKLDSEQWASLKPLQIKLNLTQSLLVVYSASSENDKVLTLRPLIRSLELMLKTLHILN